MDSFDPLVGWIASDTGRLRKEHREREQALYERAEAEGRPLVLVTELEVYAKATVRLDPLGRRFYADAMDELEARYEVVKEHAQADPDQKVYPKFNDRQGTWEWAHVNNLLPKYAQEMADEFVEVVSDPSNSTTQARPRY